MTPYSYAIKNKTWESTITVERAALEDDLYGQIPLRIKQMARSAKQHLDILTFGVLASGFTQPGYDAVPFFGTHAVSGTAGQSNKGTDGLNSASLQAAVTAMMRFQDDQGKPAGVTPDLLVVAPENYWEARILLESTYYPDPLTAGIAGAGDEPVDGNAEAAVVAVPGVADELVHPGHQADRQGGGAPDAEGFRVHGSGR